jgi:hypothetical protein
MKHRGLHDPAQPVQSLDVPGQQVVLDDAPVLGPVLRDDGVVILAQQRVAAGGPAAGQVGGLLALITDGGTRSTTVPLRDRRLRRSVRVGRRVRRSVRATEIRSRRRRFQPGRTARGMT